MDSGPPEPKMIYSTFPGPDLAADITPQTSSALGRTMIRLLAAVQTRKKTFFHSVQTDWCYTDPDLPESKINMALLPARLFLSMPPPKRIPFWKGPAPKRKRLGFPAKLRGARARRIRRQKGADCSPSPEEHPPGEHAEFRVPAAFISRISEISYRAPVWAIHRFGGSQRPVIKVHIFMYINRSSVNCKEVQKSSKIQTSVRFSRLFLCLASYQFFFSSFSQQQQQQRHLVTLLAFMV